MNTLQVLLVRALTENKECVKGDIGVSAMQCGGSDTVRDDDSARLPHRISIPDFAGLLMLQFRLPASLQLTSTVKR
jgi:hypothetical protein